jgi:hypothetical protein
MLYTLNISVCVCASVLTFLCVCSNAVACTMLSVCCYLNHCAYNPQVCLFSSTWLVQETFGRQLEIAGTEKWGITIAFFFSGERRPLLRGSTGAFCCELKCWTPLISVCASVLTYLCVCSNVIACAMLSVCWYLNHWADMYNPQVCRNLRCSSQP